MFKTMNSSKMKMSQQALLTLDRYTEESTFKEYLANADDFVSAKELNWLIDEGSHAKQSLLTKELQDYQGPAPFVFQR
jgi:hypothetical protein